MLKVNDLYSNFSRIDLDARGGYARVSQVRTLNRSVTPEYCAFKVMRHELIESQSGIKRFESELKTLVNITSNKNFPPAITKIYDSGFVSIELSENLKKPEEMIENTGKFENTNSDLQIVSTGTDIQAFVEAKNSLANSNLWLPYLVLELAPYNNSLLRQIRQYAIDPTANTNLLPAREIVSMAVQLLNVMEYLQQQDLAYMDWKPEHIYWDSQTQLVKLIDWNVTNILLNNNERNEIVREDIRLFCGAALYCSLALSDPEEMQRPIGPNPKLSNNSISFFHRRYWTDEPIFYERSSKFDNNIKQLVKKGLDPNQGFDTPQEIKYALLNYAKQNLNSTKSVQAKADSPQKVIPRDSIQNYRRARSYISAGDFQYAMAALVDAVETARKQGVEYSDAEKLLEIVNNRLASDDLKQRAEIAIETQNWKNALDLYNKALKQDPTNVITNKEIRDVQSILYNEAEILKQKGFLKLFSNLKQLHTLREAIKGISGFDNSLMKSVDGQINQIRLVRTISNIILIIIAFTILGTSTLPTKFISSHYPSNTPAATSVQTSIFHITTYTLATTPKPIISPTQTITTTSTLTFTPTETILGLGYINKRIASVWVEPNKGLLDKLGLFQPVVIIEQRSVSGSTWYKCKWEINGISNEGWIISDNINLGNIPNQKP